MPGKTHIGWTDMSWNPTVGCTQVSPGCANCYALELTERFHGPGSFDKVILHPDRLEQPLHWQKPRRIFVNSMSDLFHESIPDEYIDRVFAVMMDCQRHTFQILTKRIARAHQYLENVGDRVLLCAAEAGYNLSQLPLENVLVGPTIENQHWADVRGPFVSKIHALGWRTMVSYEPALGPVDFWHWLFEEHRMDEVYPTAINWLIVGGESGSKRRPFNPQWAAHVVEQCRLAEVPVFVKQGGALRPGQQGDLSDELFAVKEFPS